MIKLPTALSPRDTAAIDALTRAMGDRHLTKDQRLGIAGLIKEILDQAAASA